MKCNSLPCELVGFVCPRTCYNCRHGLGSCFLSGQQGDEPVKDSILGQPDGAIAEIFHVLKLLRQFNITLGMPYVRKIDKSGLRELRIKHGSDIYRIFFFAHTGRKFILLHAILKKEDKTPESDKVLAIKRMNAYEFRY